MDPVTAANLASAGLSLGKGIHQSVKAHKLSKKYKRPEYKRPEEIKKATDIYRQRAAGLALPGESIMRERIGESKANLIRKGAGSGEGLSFLKSLEGSEKAGIEAEKDLRIEAAEQKRKAEDKLAQAYNKEAQYSDKEWEYNKRDPYAEAMAAASALRGAGWKNIESGLNKGISAGVGASGGAPPSGGSTGVGGAEGAVGQQSTAATTTDKKKRRSVGY